MGTAGVRSNGLGIGTARGVRRRLLLSTAMFGVLLLPCASHAADLVISGTNDLPTNDATFATTAPDNIVIQGGAVVDYQGIGGASVMTSGGGTITNNGTLQSTGADTLTITGAFNMGGGVLIVSGGADVFVTSIGADATSSIDVSNGNLVTDIVSAGALNVDGTLTGGFASSGAATIGATGEVTGNASNGNGTLTSGGTIGGTLSNLTSGAVELTGGTVTGTVSNAGTGTLLVSGSTLTGAITNDSASASAVTINSGVTLTAPSLTNNAGTAAIDGTLDGDLTNAATADISATGEVTGNVSNTGTLTSAGSIGGTLANSGAGSVDLQGGTVSGAVSNADTGTLLVSGDTSTGAITSDSTSATAVTVNNGVTLTSASLTNNAGTATINGTLTGDLTNSTPGTAEIASTGAVSGNATNTGTLTVAGSIVGELDNNGAGAVELAGAAVGGAVYNGGTATIHATTDSSTGLILNSSTTVNAVAIDPGVTLTADLNNGNVATTTIEGTLDGLLSNSGTTTIAGTGTVTGNANNSGSLTNNGTIDGAGNNLLGGAFINNGTIGSGVSNAQNSQFTNTGTITGNLRNRNTGAVDLAGGSISGTVSNEDTSTLRVTANTSTGAITNTSTSATAVTVDTGVTLTAPTLTNTTGTAAINGTLAGDLSNAGATNIGAAGQVSGGATNGGTLSNAGTIVGGVGNTGNLGNSGSIGGNVTNTASGAVSNSGTVGGNISNAGSGSVILAGGSVAGTISNAGTGSLRVTGNTTTAAVTNTSTASNAVSIANGATLTTSSLAHNAGTAFIDGTLTGSMTNNSVLNLAGTIGGNLVNNANTTVTDVSSVAGTITNNLDLLVAGGGSLDWGTFTNNFDNTFVVAAGATAGGGLFTNTASGGANIYGTLNAAVDNSGIIRLFDNSIVGGMLTNQSTGLIEVSGTSGGRANSRISGGLADSGGIINLQNNVAGDVLTIGGPASLTGTTINLDVDLSYASGPGDGDMLVFNSALNGSNVLLNFNVLGAPNALLAEGIPILDINQAASNSLTYATTGLNIVGADGIIYSFEQDSDGTYAIFSSVNPAVGGLAGAVTAIQSIIGSVINRPTSPFVSGLVDPGEDPCGTGLWARATGGRIDATSDVVSANPSGVGDRTTTAEIEATYSGIQFGGDFACFDERYGGWNLAFGLIGGYNRGTAEQPNYFINPSTQDQDKNVTTSVTDAEFRQTYGGVYVAGIRDAWAVDLQFRLENTEFDIQNRGQNGYDAIGVKDQTFSTRGQTLSGSVGRDFPIGTTDYSVTPVAGFSFTRTETDTIKFDEGATLQIEDHTAQVGFIGASFGKLFIAPSQQAATKVFATGTVYRDFSGDIQSVYESGDGSTAPQYFETSNLGTYGELSLGAGYVSILNDGAFGPARQLNASLRVDSRFSDTLDGWGITGQVRLQF